MGRTNQGDAMATRVLSATTLRLTVYRRPRLLPEGEYELTYTGPRGISRG